MAGETTYLLVKYDDVRPTHALRENYLPAGEMWCWGGFMYVPPEIAAKLGEPDDAILLGTQAFPAWRLDREMPPPATGLPDGAGALLAETETPSSHQGATSASSRMAGGEH